MLTNGLVVAVFTSGLLRVVRASDAMLVSETTLNTGSTGGKVIQAKIAFKTYEVSQSNEKTISLGVAFEVRHSGATNSYRAQVFNLKFTNLQIDSMNED